MTLAGSHSMPSSPLSNLRPVVTMTHSSLMIIRQQSTQCVCVCVCVCVCARVRLSSVDCIVARPCSLFRLTQAGASLQSSSAIDNTQDFLPFGSMFSGEKSPSESTALPVGRTGNAAQWGEREEKKEISEYIFKLYGNREEMQMNKDKN